MKDGVFNKYYVRSTQNLEVPLTKDLTESLMLQTSKGMGLKPTRHNTIELASM